MSERVDLHAGDRVALLQPGSPAYVDLVIGLLSAGLFPVPLDPRLTAVERERILADVDPRLVVDTAEHIDSLLADVPEQARRGLPLGRPMHVTSGTTGRPKPVDSGTLTRVEAEALLAEERDLWGFAEDDVNLVLSPLHHSAPLRFAMGTLLAGGRIVVPGTFDPVAITEAIETERPTSMFCVPTHLQRLFAHWDRSAAPDLSSFRLVAHAGAPCPPAVKRRLVELFPEGADLGVLRRHRGPVHRLPQRGVAGAPRHRRPRAAGSRRCPWTTTARSGARCPTTPGSPTSATRTRLRRPGATHRRDRPSRSATSGGSTTTATSTSTADATDLIITGGVNVYPLEVENALREHPGVEDVAVFGVPDDDWGQRVCAAVVGSADEAELAAFARERLSPPKRPKTWTFLDDLPRTPTGKVRRDELA